MLCRAEEAHASACRGQHAAGHAGTRALRDERTHLRQPAPDRGVAACGWATLKGELIGDHLFATRAEAKSAIFRHIEILYNRTRLHGALGFYPPVDFEHNLN